MSNATVVWYENTDVGAPVLSGTAGTLIGVLDAVLVNGWGLQTASSVVVAGGIATVTTPTAHNIKDHGVVEIAGATPAGLNGRKRVLTRTTNTFTFSAAAVGNQTATGTITVKLAPAGWEKVFTGTNLAVYRSPNVLGTRQFLRIDDTTTTHATVWACESMTDVNTFTDRWQNEFYIKSATANTTAQTWRIFADDRTFYLQIRAGNEDFFYHFGDFAPTRANDPFACSSRGAQSSALGSPSNVYGAISVSHYVQMTVFTLVSSLVAPRSSNFITKAVSLFKRPEFAPTASTTDSSSNTWPSGVGASCSPPFPNTSDNALIFSRFMLQETVNSNLRGWMRGVFCSPQSLAAHFTQQVTLLNGQGGFSGRLIGVVTCNGNGGSTSPQQGANSSGRLIFDLTGPWG